MRPARENPYGRQATVGSWLEKIKRNTRFMGHYKMKSKEINEKNGENFTSFGALDIRW
jgi:hypothetical protein